MVTPLVLLAEPFSGPFESSSIDSFALVTVVIFATLEIDLLIFSTFSFGELFSFLSFDQLQPIFECGYQVLVCYRRVV